MLIDLFLVLGYQVIMAHMFLAMIPGILLKINAFVYLWMS